MIGSRIRTARNKAKISQQKLADKIAISKSRLGRIERGELSPTLEEIHIISAEVNVSIGDLLES